VQKTHQKVMNGFLWKFSGGVGRGLRTNPSDFGVEADHDLDPEFLDRDHDPDPRIFKRILCDSRRQPTVKLENLRWR